MASFEKLAKGGTRADMFKQMKELGVDSPPKSGGGKAKEKAPKPKPSRKPGESDVDFARRFSDATKDE